MDYEKKYNEALERAKSFELPEYKNIMESVFPELKESEDEKIRKELIAFIKKRDRSGCDYDYDKWIAWLEKQGNSNNKNWKPSKEQINALEHFVRSIAESGYASPYDNNTKLLKSLINDLYKLLENQSGQEPADKVEPKFKAGDWVVWQDKCYKVNYNGCGYELIDQNGLSTSLECGTVDTSARLWNITKDAKDGDVLFSLDSSQPFIYRASKPYEQATAYCGINIYGKFFVWNTESCIITLDRYIPATKEQRDSLFQKMGEAGYDWDAEKKELKKISQRIVSAKAREALYGEPAWSEEDEHRVKDTIYFLDTAKKHYASTVELDACIDWLESLKKRIYLK